jgi:hypothetical protein
MNGLAAVMLNMIADEVPVLSKTFSIGVIVLGEVVSVETSKLTCCKDCIMSS